MTHENPTPIGHEELVSYALGELNEARANRVAAALIDDPSLATKLEEIKTVLELSKQDHFEIPDSTQALERFRKDQRPNKAPVRLAVAAAVGVFILSVAGAFYQHFSTDLLSLKALNDMETFSLPDGSQVTLSPGAELTYTANFENHREIALISGKAFFDVVTNPEAPFTVTADENEVQVLGTRFDVTLEEKGTVVNLQEGSVRFTTQNGELMLKPQERAIALHNELVKEPIRDQKQFAWIQHELRFSGTHLQQVVHELEDHFNTTITLDDQLLGCTLEGTFDGESLDQILELIAITLNAEVSQTTTGLQLSGPGC